MDATIAPGTRIGGYEVVRLLGKGGMGAVYEAEDPRLRRRVALKIIAEGMATDLESRERFAREARAAAAVVHPNVVAIHAAGEEGRTLWLALELVPGARTLGKVLLERGRLPWREAAARTASVARGLAAIHAAGLVHRDVKPENVLLDRHGVAKVSDFGLVKAAAGSGSLTDAGTILGTPLYISPEQAESQPVSTRSDLYSLGALLHHLVAGEPPFDGTGLQLLREHVEAAPPPLRRLVPEAPAALEALVLSLLEKSPARRPASADEVAERLEAIAQSDLPARAVSRGAIALVALASAAVGATVGVVCVKSSSRPAPAPPVVAPPSPPPKLPRPVYPGRWDPLPEMRTPWMKGAAASLPGEIHVVGGRFDAGAESLHLIYDVAARSWSEGPPLLRPRIYCAAVALDEKVYVLGGEDASGKRLASVEVYDPARRVWTESVPLPAPAIVSAVVRGGTLWVSAARETSHELYFLDRAHERWVPRPLPSLVAAHVDGLATWGIFVRGDRLGVHLEDLVLLAAPEESVWTTAVLRRAPPGGAGLVASGGRLYVVGGATDYQGPALAEVMSFDLDSLETPPALHAVLGHPRRDHATCLGSDGRIYAIGGYDGRTALATSEAFTP
jgi:hypothetical protein